MPVTSFSLPRSCGLRRQDNPLPEMIIKSTWPLSRRPSRLGMAKHGLFHERLSLQRWNKPAMIRDGRISARLGVI